MAERVAVIGAGLAGSEAALQLARRGHEVFLYEMRPVVGTAVHHTDRCAELVCSNSLKSLKASSAAGMQKQELSALGSFLLDAAYATQVPAGGALAVNRTEFSDRVTRLILDNPRITLIRDEVVSLGQIDPTCAAVIIATGPLTSDAFAKTLSSLTGSGNLAFYDAAAPIVLGDSLDRERIFSQSRYEEGMGDYLNAAFSREEYEAFINELLAADRVIAKDFETKDLFQACQPIEEIARSGFDAPRFGPLKPVGLTDPRTGKRPWAALQLRAEDAFGQSYNLVGFQTNLTFPEQRRVFRMIPGLEEAEFARYGVMHRNTFVDAPRLLGKDLRLKSEQTSGLGFPLFMAGQVSGTEGYVEAIRSGLHAALAVSAFLAGIQLPELSMDTAFGALLHYATDPETVNYQPSHVNFGVMPPLERKIRNKQERYVAYAERGRIAMEDYVQKLRTVGLL